MCVCVCPAELGCQATMSGQIQCKRQVCITEDDCVSGRVDDFETSATVEPRELVHSENNLIDPPLKHALNMFLD